jgi:glycerol-3-phosphate acyltransferase PlsY
MKVLFAIASYLVGSIPSGYLMIRFADRKDIRQFGSRSTGATNVLRVKGLKYALPVLLFDTLKGFAPAFLALKLFHDPVLAAVSGFLAALGHCFPFSIGFKGGKGMATAMGAFAALGVLPFLASLAVFVLTVGASRFVSLGSMFGALSYPFFYKAIVHGPLAVFLACLALSGLVIAKHHENIRRLLAGSERRLGEKTA